MTEPEELPAELANSAHVAYMEQEFPNLALGGPYDIEHLTVLLAPIMRRAKWLRATMAANETAKAEEIKNVVLEIEQKHAAVQQANQMRLDSMMREIERLGRMRLEYEGSRKSVILLHGQIGTRQQPTKVEIEDEASIVSDLRARGLRIPWNAGPKPVAPTLAKADLLKLIEQYGNIPGAKLVLGEERFFFDEKVVDHADNA